MSIYTTPLQFGYFLAWLFGMIFLIRGFREERLSDKILGILLFLLALDIQDYTFGFAGINILWNELNGFPRNVAFLIGPALFFFIKSQTNTNFRFHRKDAIHLLPWLIPFVVELIVFLQGKYAVQAFQSSNFIANYQYVELLLRYASLGIYFYLSLRLYKKYKTWSLNNQSNADAVSFMWFRNVIYALMLGYVVKESMNIMDNFFEWNFYQDWWWNLGLVLIIVYLSISGLSQVQPKHLEFSENENFEKAQPNNETSAADAPAQDPLAPVLAEALDVAMKEFKLFLKPDLSISELSKHVGYSVNQVSGVINTYHGSNFNDYVNKQRVLSFKEKLSLNSHQKYTLLALAYECGFNSKSTFNRSFKKLEDVSPMEYAKSLSKE